MSVQQFYDAARTVLEQHNEAVGGEGNPGFVNIDQFIDCLKATGGTTPEVLAGISLENLLHCLPNYDGPHGTVKPWPLAKQIRVAFKKAGGGKAEDESKPRPVSSKKAERMTLEELVNAFDPEEPTSTVGKRLKAISRGEPFVIYESGRQIDHDATIALLKEVKMGHEGRAVYEGRRVHCVGDLHQFT